MFFRSSWSSSIRRAIRTSYRLVHESVSGTFADLRVAQSGSSSWGTSVISCIILFAAGVWDAAPLEAELLVQTDRLVGGSNAVLVVDDTAIPRKGTHSVGVAAQYASALGKTANCQTLVSLTLARGEVPVYRLDDRESDSRPLGRWCVLILVSIARWGWRFGGVLDRI